MRAAYWARIQSSLKRLATATTTREPSGATVADRGRIQVLNCCSGISCDNRSMQADQSERVSGRVSARDVSGGMPSIMLGTVEAL
jgi:hypothetical protein